MVGWLEWETKDDKWMNDYVNGWLVERMVLGGWMDEWMKWWMRECMVGWHDIVKGGIYW